LIYVNLEMVLCAMWGIAVPDVKMASGRAAVLQGNTDRVGYRDLVCLNAMGFKPITWDRVGDQAALRSSGV